MALRGAGPLISASNHGSPGEVGVTIDPVAGGFLPGRMKVDGRLDARGFGYWAVNCLNPVIDKMPHDLNSPRLGCLGSSVGRAVDS